MKKALLVVGGIFGVLAIILYIDSVKDVKGFGQVANVQETVFCAACAIICAISIIGSMIISAIENGVDIQKAEIQKAIQSSSAFFAAENEARERKILAEGGWRCPNCGELNHHYVTSCSCGKSKKDVISG